MQFLRYQKKKKPTTSLLWPLSSHMLRRKKTENWHRKLQKIKKIFRKDTINAKTFWPFVVTTANFVHYCTGGNWNGIKTLIFPECIMKKNICLHEMDTVFSKNTGICMKTNLLNQCIKEVIWFCSKVMGLNNLLKLLWFLWTPRTVWIW